MIETSINQLTAAIVRLCDQIENKQLLLPLFGEQKVAPNATNPPEYVQKSARVLKPAKTKPTGDTPAAADVPDPEPAPTPEPEPAPEVPKQEPPTPDCGTEPTACCDEVIVEPAPVAPTITHEMCTSLVRNYRQHNAHLLSAKKIDHNHMLRIVNERFGIEAVSKCPDDKLPALYDAIVAICQPIEP